MVTGVWGYAPTSKIPGPAGVAGSEICRKCGYTSYACYITLFTPLVGLLSEKWHKKSRKPFTKISCWVVPPTGGWYSVLKVRVRLARYITLFTPLVGLLSEKWHKKSRKPFTKISCWVVPPTGGWYSVLKVRVRLAR